MPVSPKKLRKAKVRFRKLSLKITDKQKRLIDKVCKNQKTTPNKLIKKALREYLEKYADAVANEEIISRNQLKLFDDNWDEEDDAESGELSVAADNGL